MHDILILTEPVVGGNAKITLKCRYLNSPESGVGGNAKIIT
jgi:hypothetical protein